jgi:hypothetical protein
MHSTKGNKRHSLPESFAPNLPAQDQGRISAGIQAWGRIDAGTTQDTAAARRDWMSIGDALSIGKVKENRPVIGRDSRGRTQHQKLTDWMAERFPGLREQTASDALWLSKNSTCLGEMPDGVSNPEWIRRRFNGAHLPQAPVLQEFPESPRSSSEATAGGADEESGTGATDPGPATPDDQEAGTKAHHFSFLRRTAAKAAEPTRGAGFILV